MRRANDYQILGLILACLGIVAWARAQAVGSESIQYSAVALWLTGAGFFCLAARTRRLERERLVRQLRSAAADLRPADAHPSNTATDAEAFRAAVDGLIAAARAQSISANQRINELEIRLAAASMERDEARSAIDGLNDVVKQVSRETASAANQAEAGTRAAKEILSVVSHELRTPLAGIRACSEMLLDGEAIDARSRQEFYDVIYGEAGRMSDAIDSVLLVARLQAGLIRPARTEVHFSDIVRDAVNSVTELASSRRIAVETETSADRDLVQIDPVLVRRSVSALLVPAIKSLREDGRIVAKVSADPGRRKIALTLNVMPGITEPKEGLNSFDSVSSESPRSPWDSVGGVSTTLARLVVENLHGGRMLDEKAPGFELDLHADSASQVPNLVVGE